MFSVGSARTKITPRVGIPLGGNARADNYATGVLQDLYARVLYAKGAEAEICIVSLDLLGLWESDSRRVREAVANRLGMDAHNVMVACTHTHSGPDTLRTFSLTDAKEQSDTAQIQPWMDSMVGMACEAAGLAKDRAQPATMRLQFAENTDIPNNRRLRMKTGETVMNWTHPSANEVDSAQGPVDPQVTVATFHSAAGVVGGFVHFACHPAILAGMNLEVSGDYCGCAMEQLEQKLAQGGEATILFLNGALGNINHIDFKTPTRTRDGGEVRRCADSLLATVEGLMKTAPAGEEGEEPTVSVAFHEELMPIRDMDPKLVEEAREIVARYDGRNLSLADGVPPELNARRVFRLREAQLTGKYPGPFATLRDGKVVVPLQVIRIGEVVLAGAPGEMFVEYGFRFKANLASRSALIVGLANGYAGYIPTSAAFSQGGYEPSTGPSILQPNAGNQIIDKLTEMEKQTHGN